MKNIDQLCAFSKGLYVLITSLAVDCGGEKRWIGVGRMSINADKVNNRQLILGVLVKMYRKLAVPALLVLLIFSGTTASRVWAANSGESDLNDDGKADQWIEDLGNERFRVTKDRDFDGEVDYALVYTSDGRKEYEEQDYNYDGEMDDFYYYQTGVLHHRAVDTNYDGEVDLFVYLDSGVYIWKIERDTDFDGTIDYLKEYGPPPEGR
jgi:hypothetical protein